MTSLSQWSIDEVHDVIVEEFSVEVAGMFEGKLQPKIIYKSMHSYIMEYGSTPYVGMARKKNGGPI